VRAAGVAAGLDSPLTDAVVAEWKKPPLPRAKDAVKIPLDWRDDGHAHVLFLDGCHGGGANAPSSSSVRALVKILEKLDARGTAIAAQGEHCCGSALHFAGRPDLFD